jgi:exosome complex RNA-binding protein Rrp4
MEFIKVGKNYMIKGSNGRIVTEKEKLELENKELIIKDITSNECQGKTTQKITRNKKKISALKKENADEFIKETAEITE